MKGEHSKSPVFSVCFSKGRFFLFPPKPKVAVLPYPGPLAALLASTESGHMARVEAISAWLKTHAIYLVISCFLFLTLKNTRAVC